MNVNNYIGINYVHLLIFYMITNYRLFKDKVLPSDNVLHGSCKETKKLLKMLGVEYISYHACPNYVFYIEENMQTKRYVQNVGMTGMINKKRRVNHILVLLLRY